MSHRFSMSFEQMIGEFCCFGIGLDADVGALVSGGGLAAGNRVRGPLSGPIVRQHAADLPPAQRGLQPRPRPTYVVGFKQWQQLGRSVVKGQSGYMIWSPGDRRLASSDPSNPEGWRRLTYRERPRPGESVRSKVVGVKPAYGTSPRPRVSRSRNDRAVTGAQARLFRGAVGPRTCHGEKSRASRVRAVVRREPGNAWLPQPFQPLS
jgi:hypothetical protein